MLLRNTYNPITASPFSNDEYYMEIKPHCKALVPFVKCIWGSVGSYRDDNCFDRMVNPDTCMDIIFNVNYTDNKIYDAFCGIDDRTSMVRTKTAYKRVSRIAVRFYPWSAYLFTEDSLKGTQNQAIGLEYHFAEMKRIIEPMLFDIQDMRSRISIIESYLVKHMHLERVNAILMEAFETIIDHRGNVNTLRLSSDLHISTRQLERIFAEYTGVSPKKMSQLIRYQFLWQDILFSRNKKAQDLVFEYGYNDQPHMLNDFKKYHSMPVSEARRYAYQNVAFLQDIEDRS